MRALYILILTAIIASSCNSDKGSTLPVAAGLSGDIYLFVDSTQWKGKIGEVMDSIFNQEMIGLPREEGIFRLSPVDPRKINFVLKQRRNLIFLMTLDHQGRGSQIVRSMFSKDLLNHIAEDSSEFVQTYKDVYARGQQVMFLFAQDEAQMVEKLRQNGQKLIDFFDKVERDRLNATLFKAGTVVGIDKWMSDNFHVNMKIPYGYKLVQNEKDFLWARQINTNDDRDIFVAVTDYVSESQFTKENLIKFRDEVTKKYIYEDPDHINSYIVIETGVPHKPVTIRNVNVNGNFAVEMRGLWRTNTRTMGGPFLSYAIADPATGKFYYVEGFLYGPSKDLREMLRQMEVILRTFQLESAAKPAGDTTATSK